MLEIAGSEGNTPEVGRARADPVLDDVEGFSGVELVGQPGRDSDRPVPVAIRLEQLERQLGGLAPRLQPGQSTAKATAFFPLGPRSRTVRTSMRRMLRGGRVVSVSVGVLAGHPALRHPGTHERSIWGRVGSAVARRPRVIWLGAVVALTGLSLAASGVTFG